MRFMSLATAPRSRFSVVREARFASTTEALAAVRVHAEASGFRDVKIVDDPEEPDSLRFTATTPGGRGGRNVAFGDFMPDGEP